jgi:hypothetical protein
VRRVAQRTVGIEDAVARFEALRRRLAEKMVAQGFANDRRSQQELGPVGMWVRDRVMMPVFTSFIEKALHNAYTAAV